MATRSSSTKKKKRPPPPSLRTLSKAEARKQPKPVAEKKVRTPAFLYVGSPEQEALLVEELGPSARAVGAGIVGAEVRRDPAFARQLLPAPRPISALTREALATALIALIDDAGVSPRAVHVFTPEMARQGSARKSAHPLAHDATALQEVLQLKVDGRREKGKLGPATPHLLQLLLLGPTEGLVSITDVTDGPFGKVTVGDALASWPVPFSGGRAVKETSRDAPSSAHRKLDEAMAWLGTKVTKHDVVLDLGAAPGGWTRVMRDAGARVIAVDRAALDSALAKDPLVTHLKTDALSIDMAAQGASIVLCDVIWTPDNAVVVAERVLKTTSVRAAVITLKLKDPIDWGTLQKAQHLVRDLPGNWTGRLKHLMANKLEVTLLLRRS
jgi:hypothetical protein